MNVTVREAVKEDAAVISYITAASWKHTYPGMVPQPYLDDLRDDFWVPAIDEWIDTGRFRMLIAEATGIPVGQVAYGLSRDEKYPDWCELATLYILPEHLKHGIGRILMEAAVEDARRQGFRSIFLWALRENSNARRFYEHMGWMETEDTLTVAIMEQNLVDVRYIRKI